MASRQQKEFWKLQGLEKRFRRQVKTAQRTLQKADIEARRLGVGIYPMSTKTFQRLLTLAEKHVALMRQMGASATKLPKKKSKV